MPLLRHSTSGSPHVLSAKWRDLCSQYLPVTDEGRVWRYSRTPDPGDPVQGWKLHVAATILTAGTVLERIGPFLQKQRIHFKGPCTLEILTRLNSGLYYGYPQVGKCFTVYPENDAECRHLAAHLHDLTAGLEAPMVPFDGRFSSSSAVFYRYGAFKHRELIENGTPIPAITDETGKLVPDSRLSIGPEWAACPFSDEQAADDAATSSGPLGSTIKIFRAISQRGKGGVYHAADLSTPMPRMCILKEGRRHGEVALDGRDGHERVKHEKAVLQALRSCGIDVPCVFSSFEADDNFYLVLEHVEGINLESWLKKKKRRLPVVTALKLGIQAAEILARIHSAGWVWRDCKPANLMLAGKVLRPIDFEGACRIGEDSPCEWATKSFISTTEDSSNQSQPSIDLYALGIVIYYLLTGRFLNDDKPEAIGKVRKGIPAKIRAMLTDLLSSDPAKRPSAVMVVRELQHACVLLNTPVTGLKAKAA